MDYYRWEKDNIAISACPDDIHPVTIDLSDETIQKLNDYLPPFWSHGNPVDVLGDATPERFAKASEIVLNDPIVDALLVILTPQSMTNPTAIAQAIAKLSENRMRP